MAPHLQSQLFSSGPHPCGRGLRFAEFFAGIGLVRMGLEREGWQIVYSNDIDEDKQAMYEGHFGDTADHFDLRDVHQVDPNKIPDIDLATASFPCTDLSLAGSRSGLTGRHSSAFWGFIDVLRGMGPRRPPMVLLENVVGFITSHKGDDFRLALLALNDLGYSVDTFILDAKWFVPQSRPRLFVVGTQVSEENSKSVELPSRIRPGLVHRFIEENPSIRWDLRDLPEPTDAPRISIEHILEDLELNSSEWWSAERTNYLYNQLSDKHRKIADSMIAGDQWSYGTVFRRVRRQPDGSKRSMAELRTDGIAGCLRTPKGGSGRQILMQAGHGKLAVRLLTPTECARLMGADNFRICTSDTKAYFGFGDAVCVNAISWIAQNYLNPVLGNPETVEQTA